MGPGWISSPDWCASWINTYYSGGSAEACALNLQISINRMPLWGGGWISSPNWCASWVNTYYSGGSAEACALNL